MSQEAKIQAKNTSYSSCFDVIGPVMVGPSSSHTAGAINIGAAAQKIYRDRPTEIIVRYYDPLRRRIWDTERILRPSLAFWAFLMTTIGFPTQWTSPATRG